jgi:hypothetical protein
MMAKMSRILVVSVCFAVLAATVFAQGPVTITEAVICKDIQDREPVDAHDVFSSDVGKLHCFTRTSAVGKTTIQHVWYLEGEKRAEVSLTIGASPSWRTSSSKIIRPIDTGNWKVNILGPDGEILKTASFVIEK